LRSRRADWRVWAAVGFGAASLPSVPLVQWLARRLPVFPLGKCPAVYLSVGAAFALAGAAAASAPLHLRELDARRGESLLPRAVAFR
jgi:hypothetical protein